MTDNNNNTRLDLFEAAAAAFRELKQAAESLALQATVASKERLDGAYQTFDAAQAALAETGGDDTYQGVVCNPVYEDGSQVGVRLAYRAVRTFKFPLGAAKEIIDWLDDGGHPSAGDVVGWLNARRPSVA